jgi:hypothetical protein
MYYNKKIYDTVRKSLQQQGTYAKPCWFCEYPLAIDDVKKGECPNCGRETSTIKKQPLAKHSARPA